MPPETTDIPISGSTAREIAASLEGLVSEGRLAPGDVLPSVRGLAGQLGVSPVTVVAAYRDLRSRGVVSTQERKRTRVSNRPPIAPRHVVPLADHIRDLSSGNPDPALLPDLEKPLRRLSVPEHLYGERPVLPALATLFGGRFREVGIGPGHLAVVNGTFDGIERILSVHLRPGDAIAVEDPGYTGVLDLARTLDLKLNGFQIDEAGPLPDSLERALKGGAVACALTPRAQNPTGAAISADRHAEVQSVLDRYPDVLLIEDDHGGPVTLDPYFTLTAGRRRWAVIRSVSKFLGPDLRLAVLSGDEHTISRVQGRQLLTSGWVSYLMQALVVDLLEDADVTELVNRAATTYVKRRRAVVGALADRGIESVGRSGLELWIPVNEESTVVRNLMQLGWAAAAGERFRTDAPPGLRVTIAGLDEAEAPAFADAMAEALSPASSTSRA